MPTARLRLRPAQRVRHSRDFGRAYRLGGRARGSLVQVVAVENGLPHARIGLSVGKSIWKSAVRRNRVRRIFREAFRLEQNALPSGFDLILIPAEKRLEPELAGTRSELVRLATKASERARERRLKRERCQARAEPAAGDDPLGDDPAVTPERKPPEPAS